MAPFTVLSFLLLPAAALASEWCHSEDGALSSSCLDDAASFLQMSTNQIHGNEQGRALQMSQHDSNDTSKQVRRKPTTEVGLRFRASAIDCAKMTKPLQVVKGKDGYDVKELDVSTGKYTDIFDIPQSRVDGGYQEINGCGINPVDSFIYCAILAGQAYVIRVGPGTIEFVARLPWAKYNSGGFASTGTMYVATNIGNKAEFIGVKDLHKATGFSSADKKSPKIMDLRQKKRWTPQGFGKCADIVPIDADLQGNGIEEYIVSLFGNVLQIAKFDTVIERFTESWIIPVTGSKSSYLYGAGWNFLGKVFFADNGGKGVFMIPFSELNLKDGIDADFKLKLKKIGESDKVGASDGMNCMNEPSPWATGVVPFDCSVYPGPIQALIHDEGYDVMFLDLKSGNYTLIYSILQNRTSTPFKFLNAFSISPEDYVVYASLVMDDWDDSVYPTPPPFYIVRLDSEKIEFVAKVQAPFGSPIAGAFDKEGNYYIVSNPSLLKFPAIGDMKGFVDHKDKALPFYGPDSEAIAIKNMSGSRQIADIVAVTADFDGKGNASWVLAVNAYMQLITMKVDAGEYWVLDTNDVLQTPQRQNFGAGWNFMGEVFFASNDGAGVYQVPLGDIQVPNGPTVNLEKVGDSAPIYNNDGMNCIRTYSPFHKKAGTFVEPFGTRLLNQVKETALSLFSWLF